MGKRGISIGMAAAAVLLLFVGVFSKSWWTVSSAAGEIRFGLRGAEVCRLDTCQSFDYPARGGGGLFRLFSLVTFISGIIAALSVAAGLALRELSGDARAAKLALSICLVVIVGSIMSVFSFPGAGLPGGPGPSIGWSFFATLLGAVVGAASGFDGSGIGGWEGKTYVPIGASTDPVADTSASPYRAAAEPMAPKVPADPQAPNPASHRIEYSRKVSAASGGGGIGPRARARKRPKLADVGPAAVDSLRGALRFVARSAEISEAGLTVVLESGSQRDLLWTDIGKVVARRLPPDPPFDKTMFVDIVAAGSPPVRLLPSTHVNYAVLPGSASTSRENFRRLGKLIHDKNPGVIEPESAGFFLEGKLAPMFAAVKLFADYDAQYPG